MNLDFVKFENILRGNSCHITQARRAVFTALLENDILAMNELAEIVKMSADRTSVYRAIDLFKRLGIVNKVQIGWKYKVELSEIFFRHHHHISCLGCGQIIVIHEDEHIEKIIAELARKYHVHRATHQLEIQGYCAKCTRRGRPQSN
jgi:Fe2+ or Zn2+ uptake regulation protein